MEVKMGYYDILVAVVWGIVEGITEWLPVSSTGHMILVEQFLNFQNPEFSEMFLVVVQLGAILAVVLLFWERIWPFQFKDKTAPKVKGKIINMWFKIIIACLPAAIVGVLFDDLIDEIFYNAYVVGGALIIYGVLFILVENWNKDRRPAMMTVSDMGYDTVLIIGIFQLLAAIVPGTSRSGATIIGALLLGVSRGAAAEFTFYLAIPVMFGASVLKIVKSGFDFGTMGYVTLAVGMVVAFFVSLFVIRYLMNYIRKHDFKVFGYYRIVLGVLVLGYFLFSGTLVA